MSTATQTQHPGLTARRGKPARITPRPRLVSRRLAALLMSDFGALTSFYLLLSVTPMYAVSAGAGSAGAGLVTGSLMLCTVLADLASPRLMGRFGNRAVFAAGALLLGGPALALLACHSVAALVAVSMARGLGFGLSEVVIGALVATAVPPERRGEGIGLAGVVSCVPAIVALPSGIWLAENAGYALVIVITAVSALALLAAVPALADPAGRQPGTGPGTARPAGLLAGLRSAGHRRLSLIFAATTVPAGVLAAFLPLTPGVPGGAATLGLFTQALASTAGRWWAGRHGDRHGHAALLVPGLLAVAAGTTILIWVTAPAAMIAGATLFGIGFGISQNVTFTLMIDRAPVSGYGTASALWNLAYDAGYGAGPAAFGAVAARTGYPAAFALTGMLILAALAPATRDRAARRQPGDQPGLPADHGAAVVDVLEHRPGQHQPAGQGDGDAHRARGVPALAGDRAVQVHGARVVPVHGGDHHRPSAGDHAEAGGQPGAGHRTRRLPVSPPQVPVPAVPGPLGRRQRQRPAAGGTGRGPGRGRAHRACLAPCRP